MVLSIEPLPLVSTGPLLELRLTRGEPLGRQLEAGLRDLMRSGALGIGSGLPSTRALAADLGVSRGVVVGAYAQLAAEGYIVLRRGAAPIVAAAGRVATPIVFETDVPVAAARFNLRPDLPDLGLFPRTDWLRASRAALQRAANTDFAYGEPFGAVRLRGLLAPFLARTRGVVAAADRTGVFAGSSQALHVLAAVLRDEGARKIGVEEPGHRWRTYALAEAGLEVVPVPVDAKGLRVEELGDLPAVVVSPDHHFPSGVALSPDRRRALVEWAVAGDRLVLEHDYDAHFRYDRLRTGALQGLAPDLVAYVGGASALLAPTVRLGWAVLPARLVEPVAGRLFAIGVSTSRLSQLTLAELIERGQLDRHLRKARTLYRRRRDVLLAELERLLPELEVRGAPVGLFVSACLPAGVDEPELLDAARSHGLALDGVGENAMGAQAPGLVLGFAAEPEPTLRRAVAELTGLLLPQPGTR
jgi:GntR family transcriptional regulator / MocR family aminotransferase